MSSPERQRSLFNNPRLFAAIAGLIGAGLWGKLAYDKYSQPQKPETILQTPNPNAGLSPSKTSDAGLPDAYPDEPIITLSDAAVEKIEEIIAVANQPDAETRPDAAIASDDAGTDASDAATDAGVSDTGETSKDGGTLDGGSDAAIDAGQIAGDARTPDGGILINSRTKLTQEEIIKSAQERLGDVDGDPEKLKALIEFLTQNPLKGRACGTQQPNTLGVFCAPEMLFNSPYGVRGAFYNPKAGKFEPLTENKPGSQFSTIRLEGVVNSNTNPALIAYTFFSPQLELQHLPKLFKVMIAKPNGEPLKEQLFEIEDGQPKSRLSQIIEGTNLEQGQTEVTVYMPKEKIQLDGGNRKQTAVYLWIRHKGKIDEQNLNKRAITILPYSPTFKNGEPNGEMNPNFEENGNSKVALLVPEIAKK